MIGKLTPGCTVQTNGGMRLESVQRHERGGWCGLTTGGMTIRFYPDAIAIAVPPEMFEVAVAHAAYQKTLCPPVVRFDGSQMVSP